MNNNQQKWVRMFLNCRRNITLKDLTASLRTGQANDRYMKLKHGDLGSITDVTYLPEDYGGQAQIWVRWDAGSILSLIDGQDEWETVE
jgi:hypothetical protein